MRRHILTQAILLALGGTMLTGCGGGGSSDSAGSDKTSNVTPAPNVAISESNAQQKAQEAYAIVGIAVVGESMLQIASTNGSAQDGYRMTLDNVAMTALKHIKKQAATASSDRITAQATDTETFACPYGGSFTYTYIDTDDNPETLQAGDVFTISYASCKVDESTEMNGKMVVTLTKGVEISDTVFNAAARIEAQNLSSKTASDNVFIYNGILDAGYNITDTTIDLTLKSDKVQIENGSDKAAIYALDYAMHNEYASGKWWFDQDNVLDVNGEVIRVDTTARFDGQGCNYPYQGSGMIYGKNSSVKVTARSGNVTELEIDTDGNGTIDVTKQLGSSEVFSLDCY